MKTKSCAIIGWSVLWLMLTVVWLCSLVEITTLVSYHNPFTAGEILACVTANEYETHDILHYCLRYVLPYWIICSLAYIGGCWVLWRCRRSASRWIKIAVGVAIVGLLVPFVLPIVPQYLLGEVMSVMRQIQVMQANSAANAMFSYGAQRTDTTSQREVYVLSIGESVRYENMSINGEYERETTPLLSQQDNLCLYSDYYATATLTQHALPMLLCGVDAEHFADHYGRKTIAAAFNEVGFTTALISHRAQLMNNPYYRYLTNDFDTVIMVAHDSLIALDLAELCAENSRLFVVTHYLGNHMFYTNREQSDVVWRPDYNVDAGAKSSDLFRNAYDNSIRYTDRVLNSEINVLNAEHCASAWLFVSDHGEYIGDRVSGHGYTYQPTFEEYHVPLMIWMSEEYEKQHMDRATVVRKHRTAPVCADYVFQSVLDMAGIDIVDRGAKTIFADKLPMAERRLLLPDGQKVMQL